MKTLITVSVTLFVCLVQLHAQTYTSQVCYGGTNEAVGCFPHSEPNKAFPGGTVVVGIVLSDGLVLAADSRLTMTTPGSIASYKVVSDSANKLFEVGRNAIAAFGHAVVLNRSITSIVSDFRIQWDQTQGGDIDELAKKFPDYFGKLYDQQTATTKTLGTIGFMLVGYDRQGVGKLVFLTYPAQREPSILFNTHDKQGAHWAGQIDVISRLILGYDPQLPTNSVFAGLTEPQKIEMKRKRPKLTVLTSEGAIGVHL